MQSVLIVDDEKHTRDGLVAVLSDDYDVLAEKIVQKLAETIPAVSRKDAIIANIFSITILDC